MLKKFDKKKPFIKKKKPCYFTLNKVEYIDYKDINVLEKYINDRGKIKARRTSGVKPSYQKELARAIKRSRHMALMPYVKQK